MSREQQLAQRRLELLLRSEMLRQRLGALGHNVRGRVSVVDRGVGAVRSIGGNPLFMAGLAGLFAVWRPKGIFKWVARATLARGLVSKVAGFVATARAASGTRQPSRFSYDDPPYGGQPRDY